MIVNGQKIKKKKKIKKIKKKLKRIKKKTHDNIEKNI